MKYFFVIITSLFSLSSSATVTTLRARVHNGYVNPQLGPFGAIVDIATGEALYVTSLISVIAPNQLAKDCIYEFNFTKDDAVNYSAIRLVPPTTEISCGHRFPEDK